MSEFSEDLAQKLHDGVEEAICSDDQPPVQEPVAMISVDAKALRQVLQALVGPGHLIRELQATRNIGELLGKKNPIDLLIEQYNEYARQTG